MGMKLITGKAEIAHVSAADDGALNAGIVGTGRYVLPVGKQFEYELLSNNQLRIKDGYALNQGRLIGIKSNDYEDLTIENGIAGTKRSDIVVARYQLDVDTGIESVVLLVIKGTTGDSLTDPGTISGDIISGAIEDDFPLYRINIDGINVTSVERLYKTINPMQDDTGWTNEGLVVEGTVYYNTLQYRKIGNVVHFRGGLSYMNSVTIGIPEAITPISDKQMKDVTAVNSGEYNYVRVSEINVSNESSISINETLVGTAKAGPVNLNLNGKSYLLD